MLPSEERTLAVALRRMEQLELAIRDRDWNDTEFAYEQVLSKLTKLAGTRGRPYDGSAGSPPAPPLRVDGMA